MNRKNESLCAEPGLSFGSLLGLFFRLLSSLVIAKLIAGLATVIFVIGFALFPDAADLIPTKIEEKVYSIPVTVIANVLVAPVFETLLFQGLLLRGLSHLVRSRRTLCLIVAVVFSSFHTGSVIAFIFLLPAGYIFSVASLDSRRLTDRPLLFAMVLHSTNNFLAESLRFVAMTTGLLDLET